jgi:hypothetical protein
MLLPKDTTAAPQAVALKSSNTFCIIPPESKRGHRILVHKKLFDFYDAGE